MTFQIGDRFIFNCPQLPLHRQVKTGVVVQVGGGPYYERPYGVHYDGEANSRVMWPVSKWLTPEQIVETIEDWRL